MRNVMNRNSLLPLLGMLSLLVFGCLAASGTAADAEAAGADAQNAAAEKKSPPELGLVNWRRGFDEAAQVAGKEGKPLLVLFQEVPGCETCKSYGHRVLSYPMVEEAAETLFVPVVVYNNIQGNDRATLERFREPTWNNPVVRVMSAAGQDLTPRVAEDYTIAGISEAMIKGLKRARKRPPQYLLDLADEANAYRTGTEHATFAMSCFWVGEAAFGRMDGVLATRPGFLGGHEVVDVLYDPKEVKYAQLVRLAQRFQCASQVFTRSDAQQRVAADIVGERAVRSDDPIRPDSEPKYYLSQTLLKHVPMTERQACRVNAALQPGQRAPAEKAVQKILSPRQWELYERIQTHPGAAWPKAVATDDIAGAWKEAQSTAAELKTAIGG